MMAPPPLRRRVRALALAALIAIMAIVITVLATLLISRSVTSTPHATAPTAPASTAVSPDAVLAANRNTCAAYDKSRLAVDEGNAAAAKIPKGLPADDPVVRANPEYMAYINTFADKQDEVAGVLAAGLDKNADPTMKRIVQHDIAALHATADAYRTGRHDFDVLYQDMYHAELTLDTACKTYR